MRESERVRKAEDADQFLLLLQHVKERANQNKPGEERRGGGGGEEGGQRTESVSLSMDAASFSPYDQNTHEMRLLFLSDHARFLAPSFSGMDPQIHGLRKRMLLSIHKAGTFWKDA